MYGRAHIEILRLILFPAGIEFAMCSLIAGQICTKFPDEISHNENLKFSSPSRAGLALAQEMAGRFQNTV